MEKEGGWWNRERKASEEKKGRRERGTEKKEIYRAPEGSSPSTPGSSRTTVAQGAAHVMAARLRRQRCSRLQHRCRRRELHWEFIGIGFG